jgi:hypothetical protein
VHWRECRGFGGTVNRHQPEAKQKGIPGRGGGEGPTHFAEQCGHRRDAQLLATLSNGTGSGGFQVVVGTEEAWTLEQFDQDIVNRFFGEQIHGDTE